MRDSDDHDAWTEFESLYRPLIAAMARRHGLQMADADDLTQTVLVTISQAISRFDVDPRRGQFRTWLKTIARRATINALTRRPIAIPLGGSSDAWLAELPDNDPQTDAMVKHYRREVFRLAAMRVKVEFASESWECFQQCAIEGMPAKEVARRLNRSIGSVYTARSRIVRRLREVVSELDIETET
ncbi:MAG: sigma-70 family RNA polymerase sigma factor [Planctomycetota bacterium]